MRTNPFPPTKRRLTFEQWMVRVDTTIASMVGGLTSMDLPDYAYRDAYDDGVSPSVCANRAVKAAEGY